MFNSSVSPTNPVVNTQNNTEELPAILISNESSVTKAQNIYEKISEEKERKELKRNPSIERSKNWHKEINENIRLDRPDSPLRARSSSAPFTLKITS